MKQFKRIISLVIAMTMLVSMFSVGIVSTSAETQSYILGDVNLDGRVSVIDATLIQRSVANLGEYKIADGSIEFAAADVNVDEKISVFDATLIQQYVAQIASAMTYGIGDTRTFGDPEYPTDGPTDAPTGAPTDAPTDAPTAEPTEEPTAEQTEEPTAEPTEEPTAEPTEEPTAEPTDAPTEADGTPGYYLVGSLNGQSLWGDAPFTADRKLADEDGDGIYTLDWTFYMGDELKVVEYDG
ncbi:MAG: PT domain-containing protein, partial [Ruminococcus sp.]|nr:PT domain-containing protein [Ruminococcus sp.]